MKKLFIFYSVVGLGMILFNNTQQASTDCLDDRLHINEYGVCRYMPVCCSCPCWRYKHSPDRNRCIECLHFRDPKKFRDEEI